MAQAKSSFLDRVLTRIGRLDAEGLQTVVTRLARERSFLETLFNAIEDGVLVVDENGRIIYFNQAVTRLLNWSADQVEGRSISDFLPELKWETLSAPGPKGQRGPMHHEFEMTYPRPRFLRVYAAPLDGDAKGSSGMALILHDATEARQQAFEAIESERIHSLTLLAGSVAHEIGNPLNALHIHLQLLTRQVKKLRDFAGAQSPPNAETGGIAEKLDHYLDVAKGEITRLDYIVTQYLQAIRPSAPQLAAGSLNDVARETLELLRPEMENRGLTVKEKLARRLPLSPMDQSQIKQVLVNLIKNAMQAMTRGGTLTVQSGSVGDTVWISVGDTGGGIAQDEINHIFEPFYTTKKKGTGLGLMIVQRIVSRHGGRIELESHVGQGTTFRIHLPSHERRPKLLEATKG
ncbi:MAG TPA: ATP-binding protein [Verrucomicrobiae bacterium]|jgi:PAS domain S-box-containing protein|nr:ATP-binding protein [Verrucomicrobiae bacterium]